MRKKFFITCLMMVLLFSSVHINAAEKSENKINIDLDEFIQEIRGKVETIQRTEQNEKIEFEGLLYENKSDYLLDEANTIHLQVEEYLKGLDQNIIQNSTSDLNELGNLLDDLDKLTENEKVDGKIMKSSSGIWRAGDILYYAGGSDNGNGDKSLTGHTAVLSNTALFVIEATIHEKYGAKVFHWDRDHLWEGCSEVKQYKVTSWVGTEASADEKQIAVEFGLEQVDKPYALKTPMWTDDKWYCSKLTFRQWDEAGYDLSSYNISINGFTIVPPDAIRFDANTRLYEDWGSSTPGLTN